MKRAVASTMSTTSFGERMIQVRGERTQAEFAKLLGIGRNTVIRYEGNLTKPDVDLVLKLNLLFNVQPLWLLSGVGEPAGGEQLSPEEHLLVNLFRRMDAQDRKAFLRIVESMNPRANENAVTLPPLKSSLISEKRPTSLKKGTFVKAKP